MRYYATTTLENLNASIKNPIPDDSQFEFKSMMLQMRNTIGQFAIPKHEDPHSHLKSFIQVANDFRLPGISDDALRLKLFPFSLSGQATAWLNAFPPDSTNLWGTMVDKFLTKYFPPTKNADVREEIISFRQRKNEAVDEAWERFKELMRSCPNLGIPACVQIEHFYRGCDIPTKMMLNTVANGKLTFKTYNEIVTILDQLTEHNDLWYSERSRIQPKTIDQAGVFNLDAMSSMQSQLDTLTQMMKNMQGYNPAPTPASTTNTKLALVYHMIESICYYCGDSHNSENCLSNPASLCYIAKGNQMNFNPYSNTYNPGWRHHPNFHGVGNGVSTMRVKFKTNNIRPITLLESLLYLYLHSNIINRIMHHSQRSFV
ncbi:uncharacterized protein LOC111015193 [Momordica charantia]|uniref:Uncharacterized protein LOC111015193 n=1 Tax=Momordica charantia TaxID=3673 RepID=A0A6J1CXK1_MOMCH|nr:uncharacterized protein LOC111015193 [Momordica charantia]